MSTVEMAQAAKDEGFYDDEPHDEREPVEVEDVELFDEATGPMEE